MLIGLVGRASRTLKVFELPSGGHVPESCRAIRAGRRQRPAIGCEGNAGNWPPMPAQDGQPLSTCYGPHRNRAIAAPRREGPAIGRESHRSDPAVMAAKKSAAETPPPGPRGSRSRRSHPRPGSSHRERRPDRVSTLVSPPRPAPVPNQATHVAHPRGTPSHRSPSRPSRRPSAEMGDRLHPLGMIAQASPFGGIRARVGLAHQEGPGQDNRKQADGQPPRHNRESHARAAVSGSRSSRMKKPQDWN